MPQRFNFGTASSTHRSSRGSVFEAAKVGAPEETRFLKGTFRLQKLANRELDGSIMMYLWAT